MPLFAAPLHTGILALLPRLRRFGRALAVHPGDADDLVQLAVERALRRSSQWQPDTRLDSWMLRIMIDAWNDDMRHRTPRNQLTAPDEAGPCGGADADPGGAQRQPTPMRRAISLLPDEQRIVIALVLVDGMAYQDSAQVLQIPMGTLTSRLARARDALRGLLSDQARTVS